MPVLQVTRRARAAANLAGAAVFSVLVSWAGPDADEPLTLTILQTTDVHGHVMADREDAGVGDWCKAAAYVQGVRRRLGADHCLLIDCGDTVQGSFVAAQTSGQVSVDLLNYLAYDAWIPGNHELDFGTERLRQLLQSVRVPVLNGNFHLAADPPLPAWRRFSKAGVSVVVVGLNSGYLHHWFDTAATRGFVVTSAVAALERLMPELHRQRPDLLVLALHQGWLPQDPRGVNEVGEISQLFPEIDLILGGHTHREVAGLRLGRAWYVQAGYHARYVAHIEVRCEPQTKAICDISSRLVPTADLQPDAEAVALLAESLALADARGAEELATPGRAIGADGFPGRDCAMSDLIARAIAAASGARVSLHGTLSEAAWPAAKPITERDLFAAVPYENEIIVLQLTAAELAEVVNEQLAERESRGFSGVWGIDIVADAASATVRDMKLPGGQLWPPDERLPIAVNSYTAAGGGGRFPRLRQLANTPAVGRRETGIMTRDAVRRLLQEAVAWDQPPRHWLQWQ